MVHVGLGADDLEGVERPAVAGGVDAGVQDGKARLVKVAADAGEQVGLIGGKNQHLQPFTNG